MHLSVAASEFEAALRALPDCSAAEAPPVVRLILDRARAHRASDVHLIPTADTTLMWWRIDGVLHEVAAFDRALGQRILTRLKVVSGLLTYRSDIPQEGRIAREHSDSEVRVSTIPSLHGEKAAIRLFAQDERFNRVARLGFPADIADNLYGQLQQTSGIVLFTGPSGSGKTTTAYACLREMIQGADRTRSVMTLEDPIEVEIEGITQSQVRPSVGFDLSAGLKALMRQDPDVILVGEIRDPGTAEALFQAALTGHLVLTTFHAGSSAEAIGRLLEMQIEPYLMRSTIRSIICQRLLRRCCSECRATVIPGSGAGIPDKSGGRDDHGGVCTTCGGTGYHGRMVLAELLDLSSPEVARAVLQRCAATDIARAAEASGMTSLPVRAESALLQGMTDRDEIFRVFGRQAMSPASELRLNN